VLDSYFEQLKIILDQQESQFRQKYRMYPVFKSIANILNFHKYIERRNHEQRQKNKDKRAKTKD